MSDCPRCAWFIEQCIHPDAGELHALNAINRRCEEFDPYDSQEFDPHDTAEIIDTPQDHMALGQVLGTLPDLPKDPEEGETK